MATRRKEACISEAKDLERVLSGDPNRRTAAFSEVRSWPHIFPRPCTKLLARALQATPDRVVVVAESTPRTGKSVVAALTALEWLRIDVDRRVLYLRGSIVARNGLLDIDDDIGDKNVLVVADLSDDDSLQALSASWHYLKDYASRLLIVRSREEPKDVEDLRAWLDALPWYDDVFVGTPATDPGVRARIPPWTREELRQITENIARKHEARIDDASMNAVLDRFCGAGANAVPRPGRMSHALGLIDLSIVIARAALPIGTATPADVNIEGTARLLKYGAILPPSKRLYEYAAKDSTAVGALVRTCSALHANGLGRGGLVWNDDTLRLAWTGDEPWDAVRNHMTRSGLLIRVGSAPSRSGQKALYKLAIPPEHLEYLALAEKGRLTHGYVLGALDLVIASPSGEASSAVHLDAAALVLRIQKIPSRQEIERALTFLSSDLVSENPAWWLAVKVLTTKANEIADNPDNPIIGAVKATSFLTDCLNAATNNQTQEIARRSILLFLETICGSRALRTDQLTAALQNPTAKQVATDIVSRNGNEKFLSIILSSLLGEVRGYRPYTRPQMRHEDRRALALELSEEHARRLGEAARRWRVHEIQVLLSTLRSELARKDSQTSSDVDGNVHDQRARLEAIAREVVTAIGEEALVDLVKSCPTRAAQDKLLWTLQGLDPGVRGAVGRRSRDFMLEHEPHPMSCADEVETIIGGCVTVGHLRSKRTQALREFVLGIPDSSYLPSKFPQFHIGMWLGSASRPIRKAGELISAATDLDPECATKLSDYVAAWFEDHAFEDPTNPEQLSHLLKNVNRVNEAAAKRIAARIMQEPFATVIEDKPAAAGHLLSKLGALIPNAGEHWLLSNEAMDAFDELADESMTRTQELEEIAAALLAFTPRALHTMRSRGLGPAARAKGAFARRTRLSSPTLALRGIWRANGQIVAVNEDMAVPTAPIQWSQQTGTRLLTAGPGQIVAGLYEAANSDPTIWSNAVQALDRDRSVSSWGAIRFARALPNDSEEIKSAMETILTASESRNSMLGFLAACSRVGNGEVRLPKPPQEALNAPHRAEDRAFPSGVAKGWIIDASVRYDSHWTGTLDRTNPIVSATIDLLERVYNALSGEPVSIAEWDAQIQGGEKDESRIDHARAQLIAVGLVSITSSSPGSLKFARRSPT